MYDPTVGRFLSMDPRSDNGVEVLYEHPFVYAQNNPVNLVDPDGQRPMIQSSLWQMKPRFLAKKAVQLPRSTCEISVHCYKAQWPSGSRWGWHCGLTVYDGSSPGKVVVTSYDGQQGPGGCIVIQDGGPKWRDIEGSYEMGRKSFTPDQCACIRRQAIKFNETSTGKGGCIPYQLLTCNSNYALNCLIRTCKLNFVWSHKPVGYDCLECVRWEFVPVYPGGCSCVEWRSRKCPGEP